jgi:acetyltransferase
MNAAAPYAGAIVGDALFPARHAPTARPPRPGGTEAVVVRDGRHATLRPIRDSDTDALRRFFLGLSPQSRVFRFHGVVNLLPDAVMRAMTQSDGEERVVLVAEASTDDGVSRLVAEARYVVDPDRRDRAEFAIAVADGWQGSGLGRALIVHLQQLARAQGLRGLDGSVLAGNGPMLGLMTRLGATISADLADTSIVQAHWDFGSSH